MFQQAIENYLTTHHFDKLNLKAVQFDMDGVLFDSMKNHAAAWHEAMKQYGMHLSPEEAYMHEGRTGASTINIVSTRQRHREAAEAPRGRFPARQNSTSSIDSISTAENISK